MVIYEINPFFIFLYTSVSLRDKSFSSSVENHQVNIKFDDGSSQAIDFKPILAGEMYGPLLELAIFNKIKLNPEVHTIAWSNSADFDLIVGDHTGNSP